MVGEWEEGEKRESCIGSSKRRISVMGKAKCG